MAVMLKYLRIAVTALSLTACVLLIALWVRSYWRGDLVFRKVSSGWLYANSAMGSVELGIPGPQDWSAPNDVQWTWKSIEINAFATHAGFSVTYYGGIVVPHWFLAFLATATASLPWIQLRCRFSLRTLLIATTLVAVAMGIIAVSG